MARYNTNLASEFYVLSMLHRLGAEPSLTLANKKAVDIYVAASDEEFITIDVKGLAGPYDWPASTVREMKRTNHFYVLVSYEGSMQEPEFLPSVWVIPGREIRNFLKDYPGGRRNISRALVRSEGAKYKNAWSQLVEITE